METEPLREIQNVEIMESREPSSAEGTMLPCLERCVLFTKLKPGLRPGLHLSYTHLRKVE